MRPVHQAARVIPFIHAAYLDAVADANRYGLSQIDIVGDQKGTPGAGIQYETLMARSVIVIG